METARRILMILAIAGVLGATGNALSPRGLSWSRPLGRGIADQVAAAGMVPVDLKTVQELVRRKSVRFIDARTPEEFAIGRLPGAIHIPWNPDAREPSVPLDPQKPLVLYCGNEFCEQSLRLGEHLRKRGYRDLAVFVDGYEAWWNAGGSVDQD